MKKILWCSVLFALLAAGLLLTWADGQTISSPGVAYFYNPMWACGDAPPFLVVDISVNREQYKGTPCVASGMAWIWTRTDSPARDWAAFWSAKAK